VGGCVQDLCHKVCETLSMVANVSLVQPDYVMVDATECSSLALAAAGGGGGGGAPTTTASVGDLKTSDHVEPSVARVSSNGVLPFQGRTSLEVQPEGSIGPPPATIGGTTGPCRHSSGSGSSLADHVRRGSLEESDGSGSERSTVKGTRGKRRLPLSVELLQPALQALTVLSNVSVSLLIVGVLSVSNQ